MIEILRVLLESDSSQDILKVSSFHTLLSLTTTALNTIALSHNSRLFHSIKQQIQHLISGSKTSYWKKYDSSLKRNSHVLHTFIAYQMNRLEEVNACVQDSLLLEIVLNSIKSVNMQVSVEMMVNT